MVPAIEVIGIALAQSPNAARCDGKFGSLDDGAVDERRMERDFANTPDSPEAQCWYWVCKLQARFMAGDYATALDAASRAQPLLTMSFTIMEAADYHLYSALSYAASVQFVTRRSTGVTSGGPGVAPPAARRAGLRPVRKTSRTAPQWSAPRSHDLHGRELEAEQLYEQAIRSARANGFVHNEALAYELAARFYAARGFEKIADAYLREARYGYQRWGADGKVAATRTVVSPPQKGIESLDADSTFSAATELLGFDHRTQGIAGGIGRNGPGKTNRQSHARGTSAGRR